jgi:hypothetical protein
MTTEKIKDKKGEIESSNDKVLEVKSSDSEVIDAIATKAVKPKVVSKNVNPFPNPFKNNAGGKGPKHNAPTFRIRKSLSGKS